MAQVKPQKSSTKTALLALVFSFILGLAMSLLINMLS